MTFRTIARSAVALLASLGLAGTAHADVFCQFSLSSINVTPDGWLNVAFTTPTYGKGWWLCSVGGSTAVNDGYTAKTINSDTCKAIFSQLLTLKMSSRPIILQFHGPADCGSSSLPADGTQPALFPANFVFSN